MRKREPVFLFGGILTGLLGMLPFISIGAACSVKYRSLIIIIPFIIGALGVFALIQYIVSRKKFQTLKNFYLLSGAISLALIIILYRIMLVVWDMIVKRSDHYFESETGHIIAAVIIFAASAICILLFMLIFGLITKHKSEYVSKISEDVSQIAEKGADIHIEEKGSDELAVLSRSINQMNADLQDNKLRQQKAEQQKTELISNVSHDLRSPLTSIMGYVQLLKDYSDRNDEKFSEYIEVTDRRLNGLNKLINELFELTKMDSPSFILNTEPGDVTAFIKQFGYEMNAILKQNDLNLICAFDNADFFTAVDFERLARVMENLFANVQKYAPKHTNVILESKAKTDSIIISLSNSIREGTEINTEDMFDRFYRDDHARTDTDSAGLGLAIAKRIVELHGGKIFAKTDSGIITITIILYSR